MKSDYPKDFPKIGSPAFNALMHNGITFSDLPSYSEKDLLSIHGIGPKAVRILREYLGQQGLRFYDK